LSDAVSVDIIHSYSLHGPVRELHQDNGISDQIKPNQSMADRLTRAVVGEGVDVVLQYEKVVGGKQ
jgi:hypothetical protein